MDYMFTGVNQHSLPLASANAMQIGYTLPRLLQCLAYANPSFGPPAMLKFHLSDGYYRVRLSPQAALEIAVILPGDTPHQNFVGIPLSLPMGWALSPPYFCSFTETAADIANAAIQQHTRPAFTHPLEIQYQNPAHPVMLDTAYSPTCVHPPGLLSTTQLQYVDIYIDDFLGLAQQPCLQPTLHHIVQGIFQIFRDEPHPDDPPDRRHIISEMKLAKGDAAWSTQKIILGWLLDTAKGTLSLPSHKAARLRLILAEAKQKTRASRCQWQKLLGELRHMASALWGAKYLFSTLQHVLSDTAAPRLRLSPLVKATLHDWSLLATSLETHPVPIASLVPQAPSYLGAVDASSAGCGGFWVATKYGRVAPFAFHWKFPTAIQHQLLSLQNPLGTLTNSDLELSAVVLGGTSFACMPRQPFRRPSLPWTIHPQFHGYIKGPQHP